MVLIWNHTKNQREEQDFHDIGSSGLRRNYQNGWKRLWKYKKSPLKVIFLQMCLSRMHICNFWASEHQMIPLQLLQLQEEVLYRCGLEKKKRHVAPNNLPTLNIHQLKEGGGVWIANNCERAHSKSGLLFSLPRATDKCNSKKKERKKEKGIQIVWRVFGAKWRDVKTHLESVNIWEVTIKEKEGESSSWSVL